MAKHDAAPVLAADLPCRALRLRRRIVARSARPRLLAGSGRALWMGPSESEWIRLAACGESGGGVGGRTAGARIEGALSAALDGAHHRDSHRQGAGARAVRGYGG